MDRKKLFKCIVFLVLFIFVVNYIATELYWYYSIWWFDMFMHFLGGFWAGLIILYFSFHQELNLKFILKILLSVFLAGFLWEMFEILVDKTISQNPFNVLDTLSDLFFDLGGGGASIFYVYRKIILKK